MFTLSWGRDSSNHISAGIAGHGDLTYNDTSSVAWVNVYILSLLAGSFGLGGDGVNCDGVDTLPEAVGLANHSLPQPKSSIFRATGIQLTVRAEPHAVHGAEVTLEIV